MRSSGLLIIVIFFPMCLYSTEHSLSQIHQEFVARILMNQDSLQGPYKLLPHIIQGSEEICVNGRLLVPKDYSIDYENGVIYFNTPVRLQDTVLCVYERLPFDLSAEYYHRKLPQNTEISPDSELVSGQKAEAKGRLKPSLQQLQNQYSEPNRLSLMGTKSFGISVGSRRSFSFDQSMQITMNGKLSEGMNIDGTLRDDGIPLQPEGTTQELKEIDKIYVNVSTKKHQVRLGDFDFSFSDSRFGKLDRKLEGILGKINTHNTLGGALSKGKWSRKRFEGVTGKQGPYELSLQGIIVAGSERIEVNGKTATRGKDYTIDYSAATITFTPQLPIEDGDRIIAEFQQKDESYRRTSFIGTYCNAPLRNTKDNFFTKGGFSSEGVLGEGKAPLRVLLFKEDDMKNHPLSFVLTADRKKSLSASDSTSAWIYGATYAGNKKGSYIKRSTSVYPMQDDSIYEYVGYHKGDYEVSFTPVSQGDYDFDPMLGGYRYVGSGNGNYIPKIKVPLPQSTSLADISYEKRINKIKFDIETAFTKFNPNTFGSQNENFGKAFAGAIEINNNWHKPKWTFGARFRNIDEDFHFPGTPDTLGAQRGELFGTLSPLPSLSTSAQLIKTPDDLEKGASINLTLRNFPNLSYHYLAGKRRRIDEFITSYQVRSFTPFVRFQECSRPVFCRRHSPDSTSRTSLQGIGIRSEWLNLSMLEKYTYRGRRGLIYQVPSIRTRTSSISISKNPLILSYTCKQTFQGGDCSVVDLGDIKFSSHGFNLAYDLTSLEHKLFDEEYYRVAPGKGSFSRDSTTGRYYPDPHGDYEKRLIPSGNSTVCKNYSLSHGLTLHLDEEISIKLGALKQGEGEKIYFWKRTPNAFQDKNRMNLSAQVFDIYANYSREDHRTKGGSRGAQDILEVNFRSEPYNLSYTTRHTRELTQLNLIWEERANTIEAGIASHSFYQTPNTNHRTPITVHFLLQGEERVIDESPYPKAYLYGLSGEPTLVYQFGDSRGNSMCSPKRIEARFKLTDWFTKTEVPPNVRVIYPPGISTQWGVDFIVFYRARTNYSISYQGTKTPDYPPDHTLNAELRLNF